MVRTPSIDKQSSPWVKGTQPTGASSGSPRSSVSSDDTFVRGAVPRASIRPQGLPVVRRSGPLLAVKQFLTSRTGRIVLGAAGLGLAIGSFFVPGLPVVVAVLGLLGALGYLAYQGLARQQTPVADVEPPLADPVLSQAAATAVSRPEPQPAPLHQRNQAVDIQQSLNESRNAAPPPFIPISMGDNALALRERLRIRKPDRLPPGTAPVVLEYLEKLRKPMTWADDFEVQALGKMYDVNISTWLLDGDGGSKIIQPSPLHNFFKEDQPASHNIVYLCNMGQRHFKVLTDLRNFLPMTEKGRPAEGTLIEAGGDGDCLFLAFGYQIAGAEGDKIRMLAAVLATHDFASAVHLLKQTPSIVHDVRAQCEKEQLDYNGLNPQEFVRVLRSAYAQPFRDQAYNFVYDCASRQGETEQPNADQVIGAAWAARTA